MNNGAQDIKNLTVLFPESQIAFGDVLAGATSEYKHAPDGVYSYAAHQFDLNGETVTQPVIDWVGEVPMDDRSFTYTLDFDPSRTQMQMLQLVEVKRDE